MSLGTELIPNGHHHARSTGVIDAGAGLGQVPAPGAGLLLKVLLPFSPQVHGAVGFQDQCYFLAKFLDANITSMVFDAQQFEDSDDGIIARFRVDIAALPASVYLLVDAEHSITR